MRSIGCRWSIRGLPRVLVLALPLLLFVLSTLARPAAAQATVNGLGPTVRDVVEFTRIVGQLRSEPDSVRLAPDGRSAFVVTRRGDTESDFNVFEILLLDLDPQRLERGEQRQPLSILKVDSRSDRHFVHPSIRDAYWASNDSIVFRGRLNDGEYQVYRLEVSSREVRQLSFAPHGVAAFGLSKDLGRIVYVTLVPNPPMKPGARSFVVGTTSFWSARAGQTSTDAQLRLYEVVAAKSGARTPLHRLGGLVSEVTSDFPPIAVSPDGRWAAIPRYEPTLQPRWAEAYPLVARTAALFGPAISKDPLRYYTRPFQWIARRHVVYDLDDGREQVIVDAPDDAEPTNGPVRTDRLWMSDGRSMVLAGTHLPIDSGLDASVNLSASYLIEFWPESKRWKVIAPLTARLQSAQRLRSGADGVEVMDGTRRRVFIKQDDGIWSEASGDAARATADSGAPATGWRIRVEQSLDRPGDVYAFGPRGERRALTRLNPAFVPAAWGSMRPYAWKDSRGRPWDGALMLPSDHVPGRRYPLVIQTYGWNGERYYLDGANHVDGWTSAFPGRALLREGILVLAFPLRATSGGPSSPRDQLQAYFDGVQSAIRTLVAEGWVDEDRIGMIGWSASGERTLNVLTYSDAPIKAATLADSDANTLFAMTISYGFSDGLWQRMEERTGGTPFGEGRDAWIRNDPALSTDCIRAAVRIESYGPAVLPNWDIYAMLRRQYKPAEMVLVPQGMHALSRPSERMVSLQGNVDWYRFWLKGEEREEVLIPGETKEELKAQYVRWREMRELKRLADGKPRCTGRTAASQP